MKTLNARSKYVKAPDNFRSYTSGLGLHDSTGTIAILHARPTTTGGIRSGRHLCPRYVLEHWEVVLTRNSICHTRLLLVVPRGSHRTQFMRSSTYDGAVSVLKKLKATCRAFDAAAAHQSAVCTTGGGSSGGGAERTCKCTIRSGWYR